MVFQQQKNAAREVNRNLSIKISKTVKHILHIVSYIWQSKYMLLQDSTYHEVVRKT